MKVKSSLLLSVVILFGCTNNETKFEQNLASFEGMVRFVTDKYSDNSFFLKTGSVSFCRCKSGNCLFDNDVCDKRVSEFMEKLNLSEMSLVSSDCELDGAFAKQIIFYFEKESFLSPRRFITYDPCDDLYLDESHSVEIRKLRSRWYYIKDSNFP